jgi:hypothetical protein
MSCGGSLEMKFVGREQGKGMRRQGAIPADP